MSVNRQTGSQSLPDTGHYWLGTGDSRLLAVGGPIAVPHVPAHAHIHPGQIMLWTEGLRLFCDTGTFNYAAGERRNYARGITRHNTTVVGENEPVATSGSFLMGDPIVPSTQFEPGAVTSFRTAYRSHHAARYWHCREIHHADQWWVVWDRVKQDGFNEVSARYHLHPTWTVNDCSTGDKPSKLFEFAHKNGTTARLYSVIYSVNTTGGKIKTTEFFPRFGEAQDRSTIVVELGRDDIAGWCDSNRVRP